MTGTQQKRRYRSYLLIILGTGIMSDAINSIYDALQMVTGGFSGLGIVIKSLSENWIDGGIPLWFTNAVLNIPLFFLGIWIKGWEFTKKSVFGALCLSFWLYFIPPIPLIQDDMLLAALAAGVIMGVGIGCIFLGQGTTGGTDMAAALIQHKLRGYSIPQILQVIDGSVVLLGIFVFGIHKALYAAVAIFITSWTADRFMEGMHFAKGAYVITEKEELVSKRIMEELNRGLTGIYAQGIYSRQDRKMLFCVVGKKELVKLKEVVEETDPEAFVIVTDVREVMGKGFTKEKG